MCFIAQWLKHFRFKLKFTNYTSEHAVQLRNVCYGFWEWYITEYWQKLQKTDGEKKGDNGTNEKASLLWSSRAKLPSKQEPHSKFKLVTENWNLHGWIDNFIFFCFPQSVFFPYSFFLSLNIQLTAHDWHIWHV